MLLHNPYNHFYSLILSETSFDGMEENYVHRTINLNKDFILKHFIVSLSSISFQIYFQHLNRLVTFHQVIPSSAPCHHFQQLDRCARLKKRNRNNFHLAMFPGILLHFLILVQSILY